MAAPVRRAAAPGRLRYKKVSSKARQIVRQGRFAAYSEWRFPCFLRLRTGLERLSGLRQPPVRQRQAARAARGQLLIVRHQHKSRALLGRQLQHQGKNGIGRGAVKIACRLIGQHASRLGDQGAGDGPRARASARPARWRR